MTHKIELDFETTLLDEDNGDVVVCTVGYEITYYDIETSTDITFVTVAGIDVYGLMSETQCNDIMNKIYAENIND